jgi:hypothetical protein
MNSQQVSWWCVHEYVDPYLKSAGTWPLAGSPEWCALPDDDPRKLAALFHAARDWCFRMELNAEALIGAQASQAISAAADWSAIAVEYQQRNPKPDSYIPRKKAS